MLARDLLPWRKGEAPEIRVSLTSWHHRLPGFEYCADISIHSVSTRTQQEVRLSQGAFMVGSTGLGGSGALRHRMWGIPIGFLVEADPRAVRQGGKSSSQIRHNFIQESCCTGVKEYILSEPHDIMLDIMLLVPRLVTKPQPLPSPWGQSFRWGGRA